MVRHLPAGVPGAGSHQRDVWGDARQPQETSYLENNLVNQSRGLTQPQFDTYTNIESTLRERCGIDDFAIAIITTDGKSEKYTSASLRNMEDSIFSPQADMVLHRTRTRTRVAPYQIPIYGMSQDGSGYGRRQSGSTDSSQGGYRYGLQHFKHEDSGMDGGTSGQRRKRPRGLQYSQSYQIQDESTPQPIKQTTSLPLCNSEKVRAFFVQRFRDLQQAGCKICAKAFVKLIEPKKQTNHPYTAGAERAPIWWPLPPINHQKGKSGYARHKEPDHLLKPERVDLLVHIVLLVVQAREDKLESMRHIDVKKLDEFTTEAMQTWFNDKDHTDNASKKPFLREIFKVAKQYARFLAGELDSTASVTVAQGNPSSCMSGSDDELEEGDQYDEEEEAQQEYTPASSMASPRDGLVSPMSHAPQNILADGRGDAFYSLPVRSQYQQLPAPSEDSQYNDPSAAYRPPPTNIYSPAPGGMFQQDSSRRSSQWSGHASLNVAVPNNGYSTTTPTSIFSGSWPGQNSHMALSPQNYNSGAYTTQPPTAHQLPFLPPPNSMTQPPPSYHQSYEPPPPQQTMRTCVLPGPEQNLGASSQASYTEFLQAPHSGFSGDLKHEGLTH